MTPKTNAIRCFTAMVALVGVLTVSQSVRAAAVGDVSAGELSGMQLLYEVNNNQWDFNDAYIVDNSGAIPTGSFDRVGYYIELGNANHQADTFFVWASMDTFNPDPLLVGVPRAGTGIVENGTLVTNLNVESNSPNVTPGTGMDGIIEFWSSNYNANGGGAFGSNNSLFDWKDSGGSSGGGHGSFQVFGFTDANLDNANTVFGITSNGGAGIGNGVGNGASNNSPDWTFGPGTGSYQIRNLQVFVGNAGGGVPEPTTAILGLLGAGGMMLRRRRIA